jgi:hypothetical protein
LARYNDNLSALVQVGAALCRTAGGLWQGCAAQCRTYWLAAGVDEFLNGNAVQ